VGEGGRQAGEMQGKVCNRVGHMYRKASIPCGGRLQQLCLLLQQYGRPTWYTASMAMRRASGCWDQVPFSCSSAPDASQVRVMVVATPTPI
jgi:hypothetical protein